FRLLIRRRNAPNSSMAHKDRGFLFTSLMTAWDEVNSPGPIWTFARAAMSADFMQSMACCLPAPVPANATTYRWVPDIVGPATRRPINVPAIVRAAPRASIRLGRLADETIHSISWPTTPGTTVSSFFSGDSQDAGPAVEGASEVVSLADA